MVEDALAEPRPMVPVLTIVLPIFGLIFAGWFSRRIGVLGPHATSELNRFVVWLALPAMLFRIVATARWSEIWQPALVGAFTSGAAVIFLATLAFRLRSPRHLADAAIDGLNASYPNTGFLGFPLALAVFGPSALAPTLIATILTVCVLFAAALVLVDAGLQTEGHPARLVSRIVRNLARNPLLVAPALGAAVLASGVALPKAVDIFVQTLGSAASPCALVALGLFLAERRTHSEPVLVPTALLVALKLIVQPVLTWTFAVQVFHLDARLTHIVTLLAALPTGTGPFMIAEFYRREANLTANVVLASTVASLATITACLLWLTP